MGAMKKDVIGIPEEGAWGNREEGGHVKQKGQKLEVRERLLGVGGVRKVGRKATALGAGRRGA